MRRSNILSTKKPAKKKNPLFQVLLLLLGVGFVLLFGFYLLMIFVFPPLMGQCVAVVEIKGALMSEGVPPTLFSDQVPGSEEIAGQIAALDDRPDIGAVVFVVNSPGGSVVASREIYQSVDSLSIPTVAYFREVAASGGYYISTPTDYIISEPYAITGSVGVISSAFEMSELFDNLGINVTPITSGEHKDIGSEYKPMDEEEKEILQEMVDLVFEDFKSVILENRQDKLNMELFEEVLDGRVILGLQAEEIGLVDSVGTKQDAINKAAELANLGEEEPRVCKIDIGASEPGLFDMVSFIRTLFLSSQSYGLQYSIE